MLLLQGQGDLPTQNFEIEILQRWVRCSRRLLLKGNRLPVPLSVAEGDIAGAGSIPLLQQKNFCTRRP
jgi:hypothetical protein